MKRFLGFSVILMLLMACVVAFAEGAGYQVGDIVTYGHYEQDNDLSNDAEPIEWIIVDIRDDTATLLSRCGLEAMKYHGSAPYPAWEASDVRAWLNGAFYANAFTSDEAAAIVKTTVVTDDNSDWEEVAGSSGGRYEYLSGGNDTEDFIFLLSVEEVMAYTGHTSYEDFRNTKKEAALMVPTAYVAANGAYRSDTLLDGVGCAHWWLRSPGMDADDASRVRSGGKLDYTIVENDAVCVRPAFRIALGSL